MNSFSLFLLIATVVSGICWFYDFKKHRPARLQKHAELKAKTPAVSKKELKEALEPVGVVGQTGSLFFIILAVFLLRSFVVEPFRIPSGSMMPTLYAGDFIAVTKWNYAFREPVTNTPLLATGTPKRGDIIVFKYPEDPSQDYIKRVVGEPGDLVIYNNKHLYILPRGAKETSTTEAKQRKIGIVKHTGLSFEESIDVLSEDLLGYEHEIMINPNAREMLSYHYRQEGKDLDVWEVPENAYFAMGDNRDNSRDSRFWGFVPFENVVGKAVGIWLSFDFDRPEDSMLPDWFPSGIRFNRLGGIK
ncbi:MAG: signal peptidase I [Succinivibrio sp.]|nr:signal peptidase I [Succinivibrio sp.]